jgi:hypothetical protein
VVDVDQSYETDFQRFVLDERLRAIEEFEKELVRRDRIPDASKLLLERMRLTMELFGGALLGLNVASVTLLINFFVFNKILHLSF